MPSAARFLRAHPHWAAFTAACVGIYAACVRAAVAAGAEPLAAAWSLAEAPGVLVEYGALAPARVWVDGQWWRTASAAVLHGSLLHLLVNLWSLWNLAPFVDRAMGRGASAAVFVLGVLGGSLASMAFGEAFVVVGASAGIVAHAGALWVVRRFGPPALWGRVAFVSPRALLLSLVVLVILGWVVPVIAQAGHLGGLAVGCAMAAAFVRARRRTAAAMAAGAVVVLPLGALAYAPAWSATYHEQVGARALETGDLDAARAAFDRALGLAPDDAPLQNAVAYALALRGEDLDRAETLVRRALEREPQNADYWDTLGWVLCRAGRAAEGRAALLRALELADEPFAELTEHLEGCAAAAVAPMP